MNSVSMRTNVAARAHGYVGVVVLELHLGVPTQKVWDLVAGVTKPTPEQQRALESICQAIEGDRVRPWA